MSKLFCVYVKNSRKSIQIFEMVLNNLIMIGDRMNVFHIYEPNQSNVNQFKLEIEANLLMKV